jgi:hypothetical protein
MLSQESEGAVITHWQDVCLLKFPDAAFQGGFNKKAASRFFKSAKPPESLSPP